LKVSGTLKSFALGLLSIAVLGAAPLSRALSADRPVMQITAMQVNGNMETFLSKVKLAIERQHVVSPGIHVRIFQGTLAGTSTGVLYIVKEYRSFEFMGTALRKLYADEQWNRLRTEAGMSVERTIISDSLFEEVTP
jgi:hypothetical protein